jgi:DNA repair protein RecN (Recombination protein N)
VLHELHIEGLGVIDDLDLALHPGLNVLTGETGAGKTLVTVGVSLATGARANAQLVRGGVRAARVQARFDAPVGADPWSEDGEVLLSRVVGADGRGGARIGRQLATVSALAEVGARCVEIHGQHGSLGLLETRTQTAFLDRFAGPDHLVALDAYRETYERLGAARSMLDELSSDARDRERELDLLAYQIREIETVGPRPGETETLEAEEARLAHVERLLELAAGVEELLAGDGGAADELASAERGLASCAELDPGAAALAERSRGLGAETGELARDARAYRESLAVDPSRLEEVRDRIGALKGLRRKYGATEQDVLTFLDQASARLASLSGTDERLAELTTAVAELGRETAEQAVVVTSGRTVAADRLGDALRVELEELGMPTAAVAVALEPTPEPGPHGAEYVELRFSPAEGQPVLPLAKAASGGELSRVMLACRSVLADLDDVPTLVFDEVDAGIGGQAGLAVGRRLARLAADRQVVVVTHLPQIACFADLHVRVRKDGGTTSVDVLDDAHRVRELSRMLAGLEASEHGASHAEELLAEAARVRAGV